MTVNSACSINLMGAESSAFM